MSELRFKLKNKITKESLTLTKSDFKIQFKKEFEQALQSYIEAQEKKQPYIKMLKQNVDFKSDFEFSMQWCFNNYTNSNWYIEKVL